MTPNAQKIVLHIEGGGDRSVGIPDTRETVTVTLENGGWDKDFIQGTTECLKEFFAEWFNGAAVLDETKWQEYLRDERLMDEEMAKRPNENT